MNTIPNRIFFTGAPGSRWSGISQNLEKLLDLNTSDRIAEREYDHKNFTGHKGAYFGRGMEFESKLNLEYLDSAWSNLEKPRLIKSHDWAYQLDEIKRTFSESWIVLVYRPDILCYSWWHEAGGFNITYPNYSEYKHSINMYSEIMQQNKSILDFAYKQNAVWYHFTQLFFEKEFNKTVTFDSEIYKDCLISLIK